MALMLSGLRPALIEAGASSASADRAAEEAASYKYRLAGMASDITLLKRRYEYSDANCRAVANL